MPTNLRIETATGPCLRQRAWAAAAILALLVPTGGAGQPQPQSVRLRAGDGITVYPAGTEARLGAMGAAGRLAIDGLVVDHDPGGSGPITRVCCAAGTARLTTCTTERQITLGAKRTDVIGRYGAPQSGEPARMTYRGIAFALDNQGRVTEICVVPP